MIINEGGNIIVSFIYRLNPYRAVNTHLFMKTNQTIGKKPMFFSSDLHTQNLTARNEHNVEFLNVKFHV